MHVRPWLVIALAATASSANAQSPVPERPAAMTRVFDCRAVQSDQERLACYDGAVAALATAETQRDIVVMDRQQVRRTRRTLFGLALPDLNIFGSDDNNRDPAAVTEIQTTIRNARQNALGKWVITLEDGAHWIQIDARDPPDAPRPGQPIRIRRGAMGSYLANINGQLAIRVRRER